MPAVPRRNHPVGRIKRSGPACFPLRRALRPSLPFDPVFLVPALPPVLPRQIGRSLQHGPHRHHHRALNPILGFSNFSMLLFCSGG